MRTTTLLRPALTAALLLSSAACIDGAISIGEDEQLLVVDPPAPPPGDDPACAAYCAEAAQVGCPPTDDCLAVCAAQRADAPACSEQLDAFLACGGSRIEATTCALPGTWFDEDESDDPDLALLACFETLSAYSACLFSEPGGPSQLMRDRCGTPEFGAGLDTRTDVIESTEVVCTPAPFLPPIVMRAVCAPGGVCSCMVDEKVAHTCQNLAHDIMLSGPHEGCCSRVFEDLIADLPS